MIVPYKPAGLLMQSGPVNKANLIDLVKSWLKTRYAKPGQVFAGMVHRLDAPVAGVVVVARTSKAASRLSAQFREGRIQKIYLAVVHGKPQFTTERLETYLVRDGRLSRRADAHTPGAQSAALTLRLLDHHESRSLLEIVLETGRRHQIRSQLSAMGLPIVGDRSYGAPDALSHGRIALLARRLSFTHPTRQIPMSHECPLPQGWPWPMDVDSAVRPLWTIEEYVQEGICLPTRTG